MLSVPAGPGANYRAKIKKAESFKETSMMARPMTVEKPLKAKERHRLQNNGATKATFHAPPAPNDSNHGNGYNERKVSSSKSTDGQEKQRNSSEARNNSAPTSERRAALDKILNSAEMATDVDTGKPVLVHEEQRNRHNTAPSSIRNQR